MRCRCRLALVASLAVVSVTVFAGCGKKPAAVVNGKRIERARYEELLERTAGAPLLVQLISEELILQEAEKQKVMPPPAEVDRRLAEAKKANPSAFQGGAEDEARRQVLIMLATRNLAFKGLSVPESEVKATFEKHRKQFDQPEAVVVRRAVFKTKKEAETARQTLMKANVEFGVILGQSIDHQEIRQNGGALPALIRTTPGGPITMILGSDPQTGAAIQRPADLLLGQGVAEKAFNLPEKTIMEVLPSQSPKGYQVIQVQEHREAKRGTYAEWQERIREQLLLEKRFKDEKIPEGVDPITYYQAKLVSDLRRKANIEINIERFKELPKHPEAWPNVGGGQ
ncbi:MAG TPA: peptidyl-prolyl cis-trans isomerase [Armatimonadota bacterium]|jgi:hypothetical protein|nr:hypothetical protein [Armatimonadota bacterium]HOJ20729.1 peptidyl-prolyl cis-trans isomerase [Armatimonadota bacterium]HOM81404.1 peptidyl-prolyl cis-trans isomerase [Armatimonadota bacterium]HPO73127.1 peptidyl-prolyl cis-trans isomerase [Armatimonadota bacterium]HPT97828.1 peptidyl-prolyl cis-trans isomerase [Armatimonadota bacterium]